MLKIKSIKTQLIIYLICFAIFLSFKNKDTLFLTTIIVALFSALLVESTILYFRTKVFQVTESSIITGLIVGHVLSSDLSWWLVILTSSIAISSKYLIRIKNKQIFNPAAFGIFLITFFFGATTGWSGTYLWYILVPFGIYFAYKIKKTEVVVGYAIVSLLLFGIQAFFQKISLWNIFGYFSYFYIFVMVIEPKTTPVNLIGKYFFGIGVGIAIFISTQIGLRFDVELVSLLVMNAMVPLLNKLPKGGSK